MMKVQLNDESPSKKGRQLEEGYKINEAGEVVPDYDHTIKFFEDGDIVKGTVVRIDRDEVLVDVGYKSEGVIPSKELSIRRNINPDQVVEIGTEIETYVLQKEDADGRLILSKKRAEFEQAWQKVQDAYKNHEIVEGTVIEIVKGGLILDVGVRGFLPASLIDVNRVKDLGQFVNQTLECKIIELNRQRNNVVLSRKAVLHGDKSSEKSEILDKITKGEVISGKISSVVDFGAFVDLGGIDGLIHISELSWAHIDHPSEIVSIGEEVKVQVLDIDKRKTRVSLGLKQTQEDFWKKTVDKLKPGEVYKAKVIRILPFGVFVQFADNLEGLIHISELSTGRIENPHKYVKVGEEVEVKLINIDEERRRISLSMKQAGEGQEARGERQEEGKEEVEEAKEEVKEDKEAKAEEKEEEKEEVKEEVKEEKEKAKEEKIVEPEIAEEKEEEAKVEDKETKEEEKAEKEVSEEIKKEEVVEKVVKEKAKEVIKAAEEIKKESGVESRESVEKTDEKEKISSGDLTSPSEEKEVKEEAKEAKAEEEKGSQESKVKSEEKEKAKEEKKKESKIKIKPAEEKLKEEIEKEKKEEEEREKALEALSKGLDDGDQAKSSDSDKLDDVLEQMKKSHGSRE